MMIMIMWTFLSGMSLKFAGFHRDSLQSFLCCLGVLSYENQSPSFSTNSQLPDLLKISEVVVISLYIVDIRIVITEYQNIHL